MTPFVGVIDHSFVPTINQAEVAEVFKLPLDYFLEPSSPNHEAYEFVSDEGEARRGHAFYIGDHRLYGLTSEFLIHFLNESKLKPLPFEWNIPGQSTWFERSVRMGYLPESKL